MEFFVSPDRADPKFEAFLVDASSKLCNWLATTNERAPLPSVCNLPEVEPTSEGASTTRLLEDLELLMAGSYQPSHPGALAHLDPPPLTASIVGELISAGLNNNLLAEELSPSITKLERNLSKWFADKLGLPETAGGISVSGGSLANLMGLLVARFKAHLSYDSNAFVIASDEAHVSIARAISVMGLPPEALCRLSTDEDGRIPLEALKQEIYKKKFEGKKCVAVIATAGTTIRGAIDPIENISEFCSDEGLWLHVDAAIGGVFALSDSTSGLVKGIEKADSVTVNPQKVLGISKTSSLLLVANKANLYSCFSTGFPYIEPSIGNDFQGGEIGLQGTRSAEIIKLWLGIRQLGENGIQRLLDETLNRRSYFHAQLDITKLNVITGPLHLIAVTPKNQKEHLTASWSDTTKKLLFRKRFMLSSPQYKGRSYLKAVMGNPHTKMRHIEELAQILNQSI